VARKAVERLLFGGVGAAEWMEELKAKRLAFLAAHPGFAFVTVVGDGAVFEPP
jgi:hypothetical protein